MKILFVVHQFFPDFSGGTESVTLGIAKILQKAGHVVRVLSCKVTDDAVSGYPTPDLTDATNVLYQGVPVTLIPRNYAPITADFSLDFETNTVSSLSAWYSSEQFDIIHCTHSMRMVGAVVAAYHLNIPVVLTLTDFFLPCYRINLVNSNQEICEGPDFGARCSLSCKAPPWTDASLVQRYDVARSFLSRAVERVVPSEFVAKKFRSAFPDISFRVIPHGIDVLARLSAQDLNVDTRRKIRNFLHLSFVGTIVPQKGLHVLIDALSQIPTANIRLSVAGPFGRDTGYEQRIRELVRQDSRITLLGLLSSSDVSLLLADTDLLCVPSQVPESFSLTIREASLFGVPSLTSDLGAQSEFIRSTQAGETAAASDANDWAQKLSRILHEPECISNWKSKLPIPMRVEEETFFYQSLYQFHSS